MGVQEFVVQLCGVLQGYVQVVTYTIHQGRKAKEANNLPSHPQRLYSYVQQRKAYTQRPR
jgi:hypothetical protein